VPKFRPSLLALAAVVAALALAASPASAAVTGSNITSPADGTVIFGDGNSADTFTVSGTSDGTMGDEVQIACYTGNFNTNLADNVAVDNSGNFTVDIAKKSLVQVGLQGDVELHHGVAGRPGFEFAEAGGAVGALLDDLEVGDAAGDAVSGLGEFEAGGSGDAGEE